MMRGDADFLGQPCKSFECCRLIVLGPISLAAPANVTPTAETSQPSLGKLKVESSSRYQLKRKSDTGGAKEKEMKHYNKPAVVV